MLAFALNEVPKESDTFWFICPQAQFQLQDSITEIADKTGSSRIIRREKHALIVGILNQYRYWTLSRARLMAADILRDYFSVFEGGR